MNTAQPETSEENDQEKKQSLLSVSKNFLRAVWQDIKKQARTAKFWIEVAAVSGGLFYAAVTYFMWQDSHHNFMIDQRAWLTAVVNVPTTVNQGTPLAVNLNIFNSGKTVARKILVECVVSRQKNTDIVPLDYGRTHSINDIGMLTPNTITAAQCFTGEPDQTDTLTKNQSDDLVNGRAYLAMYGQGRYDDIFGGVHWFRFCVWKSYYAGNGNFNAKSCTDYSDTGDGDAPK
jgi:hypothetical protein